MNTNQSEINLQIQDVELLDLYGENNSKLKLLQKSYPNVTITSRGTRIKISGNKKETQQVKHKIELMIKLLKEKKDLSTDTVIEVLNGINPFEQMASPGHRVIVHGRGGKVIRAKTKNQRRLVEASKKHDIVFALGPAGTGKTYTAVAIAVNALKNRGIKKIILTRPAVEAGESLGFLPGDLKEKIDPYLRPLYDALDDMIPVETLNQFMVSRTIEIAPLAFMRGRTLDNAFIILDEAQNCTTMQIKMFLTRLGPSAKCIITGDLSQIDLPARQRSGLRLASKLLNNLEGVASIYLDPGDVVRHRLVKEIIQAYSTHEEKVRGKSVAEEE